jgi:hypothetical protein
MRYVFVTMWSRVLIVFLAMTFSETSGFAGSFSQGSTANRQFTVRRESVMNGLWGVSYAPSGQVKRRLTFPLAYVDPGSGQLIWQMVVAVCVGGLFYIKRVRDFLGRLVKKWFKKH